VEAAAAETAAMKAAGARSSARGESLGCPSMVEAAEGAGVRPVHSTAGSRSRMEASAPRKTTRMKPSSTNAMSEAALMTKPAGSTVAPESRTARNVR
jgi:hypothetical protein